VFGGVWTRRKLTSRRAHALRVFFTSSPRGSRENNITIRRSRSPAARIWRWSSLSSQRFENCTRTKQAAPRRDGAVGACGRRRVPQHTTGSNPGSYSEPCARRRGHRRDANVVSCGCGELGKLVAWGVKWAGKVKLSQSGSGLAMGRASTRIDLWGTASDTILPSLPQHTYEAARRFGGLFGGGGGAFTRSVQTTRGKSGEK